MCLKPQTKFIKTQFGHYFCGVPWHFLGMSWPQTRIVPKGSSRRGAVETNPARNHEVVGSIPGLTQGVKDGAWPMSCGVGSRCSSGLLLLWLWCRQAGAALVRSLAWEPPYAKDAALKRQRQTKQTNKQNTQKKTSAQITIRDNLVQLTLVSF